METEPWVVLFCFLVYVLKLYCVSFILFVFNLFIIRVTYVYGRKYRYPKLDEKTVQNLTLQKTLKILVHMY